MIKRVAKTHTAKVQKQAFIKNKLMRVVEENKNDISKVKKAIQNFGNIRELERIEKDPQRKKLVSKIHIATKSRDAKKQLKELLEIYSKRKEITEAYISSLQKGNELKTSAYLPPWLIPIFEGLMKLLGFLGNQALSFMEWGSTFPHGKLLVGFTGLVLFAILNVVALIIGEYVGLGLEKLIFGFFSVISRVVKFIFRPFEMILEAMGFIQDEEEYERLKEEYGIEEEEEY